MKSLKTNIFFKIGTITVIGLLLLIPSGMIRNLIMERENTQKEAIKKVSSKWADEQTISGPYITIPDIINVIQEKTRLKRMSQLRNIFIFYLQS